MHLVTGGSGYFGQIVVQQLLARGEAVRVFDLNDFEGPHRAAVDLVRGDIRDAAAVARACRGVSHIHHNVAQVPLAKDKGLFWSVNRDGMRTLLEAAREAGVAKVVYTSSSAVYGVPASNPVTEKTVPSPAEDYGRAKLDGERLCRDFSERGLDVTIIRPRTILGSGRLGIFQILFEWIYQGDNIPILGKGDNLYQFVHADDLARACLLAAGRPGPQVFNVGAERFGTMGETLEALCAFAGTGSKVKSLPMGLMESAMNLASALRLSPLGSYHSLMYGRSLYFDVSKAKQVLGWTSKYSNIEAICQSYDWYRDHREDVLGRKTGSAHQQAVQQGVLRLVRYIL
jgi:nucleoside-diphosphate-sugar epimerase